MADKPGGIQFSPTIELGHILQAIVMVAGLGGWAFVGYMTIEKQLAQHDAEIALIKQRIDLAEKENAVQSQMLKEYAAETRAAATKISDQIADLRVLLERGLKR